MYQNAKGAIMMNLFNVTNMSGNGKETIKKKPQFACNFMNVEPIVNFKMTTGLSQVAT